MAENHEPTQPRGLLRKLRPDDTQPQADEKHIQLLIAALAVTHESARIRAIHALIDIGAPAVHPLINALGDLDEKVWRLASVALVKIGSAAVEPLVESLQSENEQIRLLSAAALHKIGTLRPGEPGWNLMWQEYRKLLCHQREQTVASSFNC